VRLLEYAEPEHYDVMEFPHLEEVRDVAYLQRQMRRTKHYSYGPATARMLPDVVGRVILAFDYRGAA